VDRLRPRLVAWAAPGQTKMTIFCNTCKVYPKYYIYNDDGSPRFRRQTVIVEVRTVAIVKKFRNFVAWAETGQNQHFTFLWYPATIQRTAYRKIFTPKQWYRWKAETLKVCILLVWRVCDQAFGRYRPLKGAEKWSRPSRKLKMCI